MVVNVGMRGTGEATTNGQSHSKLYPLIVIVKYGGSNKYLLDEVDNKQAKGHTYTRVLHGTLPCKGDKSTLRAPFSQYDHSFWGVSRRSLHWKLSHAALTRLRHVDLHGLVAKL
ncbi:hypothetical protein Salat_1121800 [Sesamum alatum]|uniref:Uncharacterized protein n=1 Tax=Sesamum alatum TaxID=300844 RepID=A0AAE2CN19_9LAMI|nr:hypothetical protein Salat_1121800 [Sesamum alatum]